MGFQCKLCERTFVTEYHLAMHMQTHDKAAKKISNAAGGQCACCGGAGNLRILVCEDCFIKMERERKELLEGSLNVTEDH